MKGKNSPQIFPLERERRRFARRKVDSLIYLNVKPDNGGIVLDLSEGGMCISVANPLFVSGKVQFSLGIGGKNTVEGTGQVAWLSASGRSAGVRFIRFAAGSRERLREWIGERNAEEKQFVPAPLQTPLEHITTGRTDTDTNLESDTVEGNAPAKPQESPTPAEEPAAAPMSESCAPSSYTLFAAQPRPSAMPSEEPQPEPEAVHLHLNTPLFFMPQKSEEEKGQPIQPPDQTETYFGDGMGNNGGQQDVAIFRSAIAASSRSEEPEEHEALQIKKFLVVAAICASLLAVGVVALLIYSGTIPVLSVFGAAAAPAPISSTAKETSLRRTFRPRVRPRISTGDERGGRPVRDVSTFYAPHPSQTSFPVEVTDPSHQHWMATVTSQKVTHGQTPNGASKGSATSARSANGLKVLEGSENSSYPRFSHPAGASAMRADGALVEEGAVVPPTANTGAQEAPPGRIVVEAVIGRDGDVKNVRLISSPASQLAQAVMDAVQEWHYRPFYRNGQPVQFTTRITFDFSIPTRHR